MSDAENKIEITYVEVDPRGADWPIREIMNQNFTRRVILKNSNSTRTSLQVTLLMGVLEDLGIRPSDYSIIDSPFDMDELWRTVQRRDDADLERIGNSVYLTEHGYASVQAAIARGTHGDLRHTFDTITEVQTRNDLK